MLRVFARSGFAAFLGVFLSASASPAAELPAGACGAGQNGRVITQHSVVIGGKQIAYSATVGFIEVNGADQKTKACVFFTSYTVPAESAAKRPVIFGFNGGPGSASIWVHLGLLGPRRVDTGPEGLTASVPGKIIDNADSLLDVADIVTIDPVATGFSSPQGGAPADPFFGAKNDYKSIAEFIRSYLNEFGRWGSRKYVLGESYGGMRGGLLAHHLQSDYGIGLNGVAFVSPWFSTELTNFDARDNELPYVYFLPSYAATAWFHHRIAPEYQGLDLKTVYERSLQFAQGPYLDALLKGNQLSPQEAGEISRALSAWTGIAQAGIEDMGLRISDHAFMTELLRSSGQITGAYDARLAGPSLPGVESDPDDAVTTLPFVSAINEYLRMELGFTTPSPYEPSGNVEPWPFENTGMEFNVIDDLSRALLENPSLKIMVASGYYDLVCPAGTVQFLLGRLSSRFSSRVSQSFFEGGHMMYVNPRALHQLKTELARFVSG